MASYKLLAPALLAALFGCGRPDGITKPDNGTRLSQDMRLDGHRGDGVPTYSSALLTHRAEGRSDAPVDSYVKDASTAVETALSGTQGAAFLRKTATVEKDDKGVRTTISYDSGWMPREYIHMLNELRERGDIIGYNLYKDGAKIGACQIDGPAAIVRRADGTFCGLVYDETNDSKLPQQYCSNVIKHNTAESLRKAISQSDGFVRTDWAEINGAGRDVAKNKHIAMRTNSGELRVIVPYVIGGRTVVLDFELEAWLKSHNALPKDYVRLEKIAQEQK
jgi:hypothetical protein